MFRLMCNTPDFIIPIEGAGPKLQKEKSKYIQLTRGSACFFSASRHHSAEESTAACGGSTERKHQLRQGKWKIRATRRAVSATK